MCRVTCAAWRGGHRHSVRMCAVCVPYEYVSAVTVWGRVCHTHRSEMHVHSSSDHALSPSRLGCRLPRVRSGERSALALARALPRISRVRYRRAALWMERVESTGIPMLILSAVIKSAEAIIPGIS